jgi:probable phosphoglycerate mutase
MTAPADQANGGAATPLVLLRHGPTDWTADGRLQGRSDRPLSAEGRVRVRRWRIPAEAARYRWVTSPLRRARETAALLGHGDAATEPTLMETSWGDWEGQRLTDLRVRLGAEMAVMEARGLDFQPPGGESPRQVQGRLEPWLGELGADRRATVAVCHKGIIRATYALATDWDMRGDPPAKLVADCAHSFLVAPAGGVTLDRINIPLLP